MSRRPRRLADALTGKTPAGISCSFRAPKEVASTKTIAAGVTDDLPVKTPTTTDRTVAVPGASWATAAWFVANAERLGIEEVAYAARTWKRGHGWSKSRRAVGQSRRHPAPDLSPWRAASRSVVGYLRRQVGDQIRVLVDLADLRGAARRAQLVEEVHVGRV